MRKSGAVQFANATGAPQNVRPEKSRNVEVGIKSFLRDRKLLLNANLYQTYVEDYQAITSELDPTAASGYSSILGNIPEIRARGVELDARTTRHRDCASTSVWHSTTPSTPIGRPRRARAPCRRPRCFATTPASRSLGRRSGPESSVWTMSANCNGFMGRVFANHTYRSEQNLEQLLSPYGYQGDYTVTDVGFGFTRDAGSVTYELNIVGKNVFDTQYTTSVNDFSNNQPVGFDGIGPRRYSVSTCGSRLTRQQPGDLDDDQTVDQPLAELALDVQRGAACTLLGAVPAYAHHAFSAEFDIHQPIEPEGSVTELQWTNPHSWLYVDVPQPDGSVTSWAVEFGSPTALLQNGLRKTDFPLAFKCS